MFCDQFQVPVDEWATAYLWFSLRLGTDDLLYGLAYGLEASVVAFYRFPQLGIAITRRCLIGCCAAYFHDELSVELFKDADACVTQRGLSTPQPSKCFAPAFNRHYLGTSVHVGDMPSLGGVRFQPKTATQWKVSMKLQSALAHRTLDGDSAGKLRDDFKLDVVYVCR